MKTKVLITQVGALGALFVSMSISAQSAHAAGAPEKCNPIGGDCAITCTTYQSSKPVPGSFGKSFFVETWSEKTINTNPAQYIYRCVPNNTLPRENCQAAYSPKHCGYHYMIDHGSGFNTTGATIPIPPGACAGPWPSSGTNVTKPSCG